MARQADLQIDWLTQWFLALRFAAKKVAINFKGTLITDPGVQTI